jgi:Tfp pilus assembly protein PilV
MMSMRSNTRGFTLIEAMLGITLLSISLLGVVAMMSYFSTQTSDRSLRNCLLEQASNGLSQHRADALPVETSFTCGNIGGTLSMSHTTFPAANTCDDVTATATAGNKTAILQTKVCNFP